jgi:hypothetical protein
MKRTQLYMDDDLWKVLQIRSQESGSSISELVRRAVRERYFSRSAERGRSMRAIIGIRKHRPEMNDPESYLRKLRRGTRLSRLA